MNGTFNKFLWKCKIDISEYTENEQHFITLREPTIDEQKKLIKTFEALESVTEQEYEGAFDGLSGFVELCNTLIIDHNFTDDTSGNKLPSKEVAEFISCKVDLAKAVMQGYMKELPLLKASGKK